MSDQVEVPGLNENALESAAMVWSYAAVLHIGLDPRVVFHSDGYKGNAEALLMNFELGVYIGVNVLEEAGMTVTGKNADAKQLQSFPKMIKWLRD
jgi:hypothetical protein